MFKDNKFKRILSFFVSIAILLLTVSTLATEGEKVYEQEIAYEIYESEPNDESNTTQDVELDVSTYDEATRDEYTDIEAEENEIIYDEYSSNELDLLLDETNTLVDIDSDYKEYDPTDDYYTDIFGVTSLEDSLFSPYAAASFPNDDMHGNEDLPSFEDYLGANDLHLPPLYKYFLIIDTQTKHYLSQGAIGGEINNYEPIILDGRIIRLEFLIELTQDIRLELHENNNGVIGNYLGLIAFGEAQGQWGYLDGDRWHSHEFPGNICPGLSYEYEYKPVANYLNWDCRYYDNDRKEFIYPGQNEKGFVEEGEYHYFLRFQPVDDDTKDFTIDIPITISNETRVRQKALRLRNKNELAKILDPVDIISGNFMWDYTDIALFGDEPLEFTRYYNALDKEIGELGAGWRHSYMYKIDKDLMFAMLTLPNGLDYTYRAMGDGTYIRPEGCDYHLENYGDGYRMIDQALTEYYFGSDGFLTSICDIAGNITVITRNGPEIISISNSSGSFSFSYSNGKINSITDITGRSVYYTYTGDNLTSYKNPDGDTVDYTYGEHGITEISDFNGNTYLKNTYDELGRVATQYIAGQGLSEFSYDVVNQVSTVKYPNGAEHEYYYDGASDLTAVTDIDGTIRYGYENGRISSYIDRLGNETKYTYDDAGNKTSIVYPDGKSELFEYNSQNLVTKITQRDNTNIYMNYDSHGNMISYTDARGNTSEYTYDDAGNKLTEKDPLRFITYYTYDSRGNVLTKMDPLLNVTSYEYNDQGFLVKQINPDDGVYEYEYSAAGKLIKIIDPYEETCEYAVNGNGFDTGITDWMKYQSDTVYNEMNRPLSVTDFEGNATNHGYDEMGKKITTTDAYGNSIIFSYDLSSRVAGVTDRRGNSWKFEYDAESRLTKDADPYDKNNKMSYDCMGQIISTVNKKGAITGFAYDDMGRIAGLTDDLKNIVKYVYDENGNLIEEYDKNDNKWQYVYDENNKMTEAIDPLGNGTQYEYDANGQTVVTMSPLKASFKSNTIAWAISKKALTRKGLRRYTSMIC